MRYGNAFLTWLPLAVAITGLCILIYTSVQQSYRQSLNDPQIQIAEDMAAALSQGAGIENTLWREMPLQVSSSSRGYVDIDASLSPWSAYFGEDGTPLESTGLLDGALPNIPKGVFESISSGSGKDTTRPDENRVTWEPREGVREALVVVKVAGDDRGIGFVVSGRNMREVEEREARLHAMIFFCWMVLMLATLAIQLGIVVYRRS